MMRRLFLTAGVVGALLATTLAVPAQAHGSATDPPSRVFGCFDRWGSDFQNPVMATEDPMCWQAWRANPNAMWNWNALNRTGVAGDYRAAIPDGQLCSGGLTHDGRFASMDKPGEWRAASKPRQFTLTVTDGVRHGADFLRVYITRQGYDALTQPLRWSDLELVTTTGLQPGAPGVYTAQVDAGTRTGRHVVYTIWQASHKDESYYMCSDVIIGGGGTSTPAPTTSAPTTPPPASGGCSATYAVTSQWSGGFQGEVRVSAGRAAIRSWAVRWTFASGQQIASSWGAAVTTSGSSVTASNASYNGAVAAGGNVNFGFIASWAGTNAVPALTCTATT
ncbi:lytic polysaccharide monooxygenase auxiliary activity family 9 protein [Micromonospora sp. CPCC 206061]|uniref:lytic polysaccharide monooxygenase auxiliary activity family 9 protein n=1 Tax=Micromonospora sp. CPCC 206061 TaxID=3122410 RepID=UPI003FA5FAE2